MLERLILGRPVRVIGWDGKPLVLGDLPPANARWSKKRKAWIVAAVRGGLITFDEARHRYGLSRAEFHAWERETFAATAERKRKAGRRGFRLLARKAGIAAPRRKAG